MLVLTENPIYVEGKKTDVKSNASGETVLVKNPFTTKTGLKVFQNWVLAKDPNALKKYGADGKWGKETSDAWMKYRDEYSQLFTPSGEAVVEKPIEVLTTEVPFNPEQDKIKYPVSYALSSVGFALGIAYAVRNKTGFWKGLGYAIIFSVAGGSLGAGVDYLRKPKK